MRNEISIIANVYFNFLNGIDWNDEVFIKGIQEGKNKFLSNAWLSIKRCNKYHKTNWISPTALSQIDNNDYSNLIFEHIVPKQVYIQNPCEKLSRERRLTISYIETLLERYWHIATITADENKKLSGLSMPKEWDQNDIYARYKVAQIELIQNPYFMKKRII